MFFISASDDKTVKVWDTARLERNVTSKPRHTYGQHHARVKCVCMLESVHCFASAADDGSLHVVRVHITQGGALPKYNKLQVIHTSSNLVYATTHSIITILDLRTMRVVQTYGEPPPLRSHNLPFSGIGASGLLLKSWHAGVASTGRFVRIHQCVVHPSKGRGKWIMVTVEASKRSTDRTFTNLVEVWDIEKAVLVETFSHSDLWRERTATGAA
ncbi:hypothetical protein B0H16DRAFT_1721421 [Mycena metata]|uniref:Uncharacterized protein n=1 Tax=Mycena metata TaxID=1033252 RepID=A0AAD7NEX1_9AGAR|nr:hypothetical protein B0H16DRAFT_1721421 [Mycena metata]